MMYAWNSFTARIGFKGHARNFLMPLLLDETFGEDRSELDRPLGFKSALCKILSAWRTMMSTSMTSLIKEYSMKGSQRRVKPAKETRDPLETYFEELLIEGKPFATRAARIEAGAYFRNDSINDVELTRHVQRARTTISRVMKRDGD